MSRPFMKFLRKKLGVLTLCSSLCALLYGALQYVSNPSRLPLTISDFLLLFVVVFVATAYFLYRKQRSADR